VYRDFQDIESFERAVKDLRDENPQLPLPETPPGPVRRKRRRNTGTAAYYRPRKANPYGNYRCSAGPDDTGGNPFNEF
jgi:hypothetical protein